MLLGKSLSFVDEQGGKNSSPPGRESSGQVYEVISPDASSEPNAVFMKVASLEATKWSLDDTMSVNLRKKIHPF